MKVLQEKSSSKSFCPIAFFSQEGGSTAACVVFPHPCKKDRKRLLEDYRSIPQDSVLLKSLHWCSQHFSDICSNLTRSNLMHSNLNENLFQEVKHRSPWGFSISHLRMHSASQGNIPQLFQKHPGKRSFGSNG